MQPVPFKPAPFFTLIVGEDRAMLWPQNVEGHTEAFCAETGDAVAEAEIIRIVRNNPRARLRIYADTPGQDFCLESLPRLGFFDRAKVLKRRLHQSYAGAVVTASCAVHATEALLAGLRKNNPALTWLETFRDVAPQIGLIPVECADLVQRLMPEAAKEWVMLVALTRTGGFRQIVVRSGVVIFSRLLPDIGGDMETSITRDIGASLGYLTRLGLKDSRDLRVLLLLSEDDLKAFERRNLPVHSVTVLSPFRAEQRLGFTQALKFDDSFSDSLFAVWLAGQRRLRLPLMPPEVIATRRAERIRFVGFRVAAVAVVVVILLMGWQLIGLASVLIDNARQSNALAELQQQLTREEAEAPSATGTLGGLRAALERKRLFAESSDTPWVALAELDRGLGDAARLVRLDWQGNGKERGENAVIDIRLTQPPASDDREVLVESFRQVSQNVAGAMPDYSVSVTHYPVPALPQEALTSNGDAVSAPVAIAELSVRKVAR